MKDITETHLYDTLYPTIEQHLSKPENVRHLANAISKYADRWSHILLSPNMSERMTFSDENKGDLFKVCGLDVKTVKKTISESVYIESTWQIATNPFYVLSVLVMHYFLKHKKNDMFYMTAIYFSYPLYISSHFASFKYTPSKEKMEYTINHLSDRFALKQNKTIQGMLEYTTFNALEGRYAEELLNPTDENIKDIIYAVEVRISSNVKNIAEKFYENHANEKVIFTQSDSEDEDNYHIADNKSYGITKISTAVTRQIISGKFDANTIIQRSTKLNAGVSEKKLETIMNTIIERDMKSIEPFIQDLITIFIYKSSGATFKDITGSKFLSEMLQLYKSNSQDEITTRIKDHLVKWIDMTSVKYGRNFISKGKTTMDGYRRAIYTCFIFKIMEVTKR